MAIERDPYEMSIPELREFIFETDEAWNRVFEALSRLQKVEDNQKAFLAEDILSDQARDEIYDLEFILERKIEAAEKARAEAEKVEEPAEPTRLDLLEELVMVEKRIDAMRSKGFYPADKMDTMVEARYDLLNRL